MSVFLLEIKQRTPISGVIRKYLNIDHSYLLGLSKPDKVLSVGVPIKNFNYCRRKDMNALQDWLTHNCSTLRHPQIFIKHSMNDPWLLL